MEMSPFRVAMAFCAFLATVLHFYAEPLRWQRYYLGSADRWRSVRDLFMSTSLASYLLPFKLGLPLRLVLCARVLQRPNGEIGLIMAIDAMITLLVWGGVAVLAGGHFFVGLP